MLWHALLAYPSEKQAWFSERACDGLTQLRTMQGVVVLEAPGRTPELSQYIRMRLSYRTKVKGGGGTYGMERLGCAFGGFIIYSATSEQTKWKMLPNCAQNSDPLIDFLS